MHESVKGFLRKRETALTAKTTGSCTIYTYQRMNYYENEAKTINNVRLELLAIPCLFSGLGWGWGVIMSLVWHMFKRIHKWKIVVFFRYNSC